MVGENSYKSESLTAILTSSNSLEYTGCLWTGLTHRTLPATSPPGEVLAKIITSIFCSSESLGSQPGGTENCFSTSSQSKSRIKVEVRDDIVIHPNVSNHAISTQNNSRTSDKYVQDIMLSMPKKRAPNGVLSFSYPSLITFVLSLTL